MKLPFAQIDAFAPAPFTGNPAAVMTLDSWLDDAVLQSIAARLAGDRAVLGGQCDTVTEGVFTLPG